MIFILIQHKLNNNKYYPLIYRSIHIQWNHLLNIKNDDDNNNNHFLIITTILDHHHSNYVQTKIIIQSQQNHQ